MKKYLLLFIFIFQFCCTLSAQSVIPSVTNDSITLLFAGDIMGHSPQFKAAYNPKTNTFNYDICFQQVKSYTESADLAIANLEVPIAGKPYSGYPCFSSPDALLDALKSAGYDILLTANNHALDRGKQGLERTISQIEKRKLYPIGTYINEIQRDSTYPLIVKIKGLKLAFLNCTYGTNGNVVSKPDKVNYIDTLEILKDIHKANSLGADFKIMVIHWGTEYELHANETQRKIAQFLVNNGIQLIIGSHPHVVQNAEFLYGKDSIAVPVFYSLGNSISNQKQINTDGGIMVKVTIGCQEKKITRTAYLPVYVYIGTLNGIYQYHLIPTTQFIKNPSLFPINKVECSSLNFFESETRKRLSNVKLLD